MVPQLYSPEVRLNGVAKTVGCCDGDIPLAPPGFPLPSLPPNWF